MQQDKLLLEDSYRGSDGSIIGTLGGIGGVNKEVHHYTFQPSKQIVSKIKSNIRNEKTEKHTLRHNLISMYCLKVLSAETHQ